MAKVLDQGLVPFIVDLELDSRIGQFGKLYGLFEKSDPPLLEGNAADPLISDVFDLYFLATHCSFVPCSLLALFLYL